MGGSLTIAWAISFREWFSTYIMRFNMWGIDSDLFLVLVLGIIIFMFAYFGLIKRRRR